MSTRVVAQLFYKTHYSTENSNIHCGLDCDLLVRTIKACPVKRRVAVIIHVNTATYNLYKSIQNAHVTTCCRKVKGSATVAVSEKTN